MNPDSAAVNYVLQDVKSENGNTCSSSEFEEQVMFLSEQNIKKETNSFIPVGIKNEIDTKDHKIFVEDVKEHNFSQDSHPNSVHLPCTQCGFIFLNHFYQKQHEKKCKNNNGRPADRRYTCGACNEEFTELPDIQQHMLKHTDKCWPKCSYCNKVFSGFNTLIEHRRIHTGEKPYCCTICDKVFSQIGTVQAHMRIHTGEKPYCCTICDKAFSHSGSVQAHMRIHTGEKSYSCSICNKTFTHTSNLKGHMRIHTGEKPYVCSICGKAFSRLGHRNYHMKIHDGTLNF